MSGVTDWFVTVNAFVYRATGGRLGSRLGRQSVLLLQTVGRKSGKARTTPLSYYRDGDNFVLVASNWGKETDPQWYRNLLHEPAATIQVGNRTLAVRARSAADSEYSRLWDLVTQLNGQYLEYARHTRRRIPIVVLTPDAPSGRGPAA